MSWKWLSVMFLLIAAAFVLLAPACPPTGDDDDDNDAGDDDDSADGGVCFWHCTWFEQVGLDGLYCLTADSYDECVDASENCLDKPSGELHEGVFDVNCSTCDDTSCWPDWYTH